MKDALSAWNESVNYNSIQLHAGVDVNLPGFVFCGNINIRILAKRVPCSSYNMTNCTELLQEGGSCDDDTTLAKEKQKLTVWDQDRTYYVLPRSVKPNERRDTRMVTCDCANTSPQPTIKDKSILDQMYKSCVFR